MMSGTGMTGYEIFWPLLAHVALVYGLYLLLLLRRRQSVAQGEVLVSDFRDMQKEPAGSRIVNKCLANQFELPVLFYACVTLLYITEADNLPMLVLAWLFVALRYAQAFVHVTGNRIRYRFAFFAAGFATLGLMWLWLAVWMAFSNG